MCLFDAYDHHTEFSWSKIRKAAKDHRCGECARVIHKGEDYQYAAGKTDGLMWEAKVCSHCQVVAGWLRENCGGYLFNAILEDFQEHAEASIPMLRCVVGMRRGWRSFADPARLLPLPACPPNMNGETVNV